MHQVESFVQELRPSCVDISVDETEGREFGIWVFLPVDQTGID